MIISANDKFLLLKYNNLNVKDTIELHKEVLNSKGYVWFGKVGKPIAKKFMENIFSEPYYKIILVSKDKVYIALSNDYSFETQTLNIPNYYKDLMSINPKIFSVFFKIIGIQEATRSILNNFVVSSSKLPLNITLNSTMSSFMNITATKNFDTKKING